MRLPIVLAQCSRPYYCLTPGIDTSIMRKEKQWYTECIAFGKHGIPLKTTFLRRALFLVSIRGGYARQCIRASLGTTGRTPVGYEQPGKTFRFSISTAHSIDRARTGSSGGLRTLSPSKRALTGS